MDELDAAAVRVRRVGAHVRFQRPLEIVDERQQIANQICSGSFRAALPIALDSLAVVVELRRLAKQSIVVLVALTLNLVGVDGRANGTAGFTGICFQLFVVVVHGSSFLRDEKVFREDVGTCPTPGGRAAVHALTLTTLLTTRDKLSTALIARV